MPVPFHDDGGRICWRNRRDSGGESDRTWRWWRKKRYHPTCGRVRPRLTREFDGSRVTSDAGLPAYRELDDALGLTEIAGHMLRQQADNIKGHRRQRSPDSQCLTTLYHQRGTADQWIKQGDNTVEWTHLSCRTMTGNACSCTPWSATCLRSLCVSTVPVEMESWSPTSLPEKLANAGTKVVAFARYAVFEMVEVAVPRDMVRRILGLNCDLGQLHPREWPIGATKPRF